MKIKVDKADKGEIEEKGILKWPIWEKGILKWPIWEKGISRFDWHYDSIEECYLLEGEVVVETEDGEKVEFGKGDFVTFPEGLSCVWNIKKPVRKHYNFK